MSPSRRRRYGSPWPMARPARSAWRWRWRVRGVQILRVHDVAAVRQALILFRAGGGMQ